MDRRQPGNRQVQVLMWAQHTFGPVACNLDERGARSGPRNFLRWNIAAQNMRAVDGPERLLDL